MAPKKLKKTSSFRVATKFAKGRRVVLFRGDCLDLLRDLPDGSVDLTVTSPPYCMGKGYENTRSLEDFTELHRRVVPEIMRVTKAGGSICWQVGYHTRKGDSSVTPLDFVAYPFFASHRGVVLRNRLVWTFGHGLHCKKRFSPRHEVVLWFTKGEPYTFDLDAVRVPQKYPGKKHFKGTSKGEYSGNPLGKNPEDVWNIPNVKGQHVEKTDHPCQFPFGLAQRLIRALSAPGETVLDPFVGSGTTGAVAVLEKRRFIGAEIVSAHWNQAQERIAAAARGDLAFRDANQPLYEPNGKEAVARKPAHFK